MKTSIAEKVKSLRTRGRRRTRYTLVFVCMAVLVGLCVQLALRQRGITLTATSEVLDCHLAGMVAHKHSAECYDSKGNLICALPERELHTHDESCYSADGKLVCGKDEITTEHVHGPGCFRTITAGAETVSVQSFKQQLKDESGKDVITIDVSAPRDALPKGATMKAALLDQAKVDQTLVQDAVNKLSGGKVLKTQAVDISFFDADGKEIEPEKNVVVKLTSSLVNAANAPVVVHVEDQREATERAAAQGTTDPKPEGTVVRRLSSQELELRDEALNKNQIAFESSDFSTYVLATTSMRHTMHAGDKSTMVVDVDAPAEAGLPADAKLQIKEVDKESEEWKNYEAQALTAIGKESASYARFFDIKIVTSDGEVQPARDVAVSIELKDAPAAVQDSAKVVHFSGDKPEVVASREDSGTTKFQASGFSVYGVMYTVDFEYQGFTYTLPGTSTLLLSELMQALGIQESVADVAEVTFTNPELLRVERAEAGATIKRPAQSSNQVTELAENSIEDSRPATLEVAEDVTPEDEAAYFASLYVDVPVADGDWILTSLKSFETEETLTVKTKDKVFEVKVTDPPTPQWGWGGMKGPYSLNEYLEKEGADVSMKVSFDSDYTTQPQERDADLSFDFTYTIGRNTMKALKAMWSPFDAFFNIYPTFVYDFTSAFTGEKSDLDINSLVSTTKWVTSNKRRVAKLIIEKTADGKATATLQVTDLNWFLASSTVDGVFHVDLKLDKAKNGDDSSTEFEFPGTRTPIHIDYVTNIEAKKKKTTNSTKVTSTSNGSYTYEAQVVVGSPLDSLQFKDTIGGMQKLGPDSVVTVTKEGGSTVNGTLNIASDGKSFTYDFPKDGSGHVESGTYTVTYTTTVSKDDYVAMAEGGTSWESNHADWIYNGNKTLDGGTTSEEIKKPAADPPTISKTSTKDGQEVKPGDEIEYTLTITGKKLGDLPISDSMTDMQAMLDGASDITVEVKQGASSFPDAATSVRNALATTDDGQYHAWDTTVLNYTFDKTIQPFDNTNSEAEDTVVTIKYKTKVISQEQAAKSGIYGQQNITNTLRENKTWQSRTTTSMVKYDEETPTKVTKKVAENAGATSSGTHSGTNGYKEYTYTIVIGDGKTLLDGVKVSDSMSGNHQWIPNSEDNSSFVMTGNNIDFDWRPYSANTPTAWSQTPFSFTFPEGTGKGPVTITYKARVFTDDEAKGANIFGGQTLTNKVNAGPSEDSTVIEYHYPAETKPPFNKTAKKGSNELAKGTVVNPSDVITYTVTYGGEGELADINSGVTITDDMSDLQKLSHKDGEDWIQNLVIVSFTHLSGLNDAVQLVYGKLSNGTFMKIENDKLYYRDASNNWHEGMPVASGAWSDDGVTWGYNDDGQYSTWGTARVFNFKFPDFYAGSEDSTTHVVTMTGDKLDLKGAITITYNTTIITADEAAAAGLVGTLDATNKATAPRNEAKITVKPKFPENLNHDPDISKTFLDFDDDGYSTKWLIEVKADKNSTYPLKGLTVTEQWDGGYINYSTEWPVFNSVTNKLEHIDLLGAEVTTASGVELQAGRDYTIDKKKGSFYFEQIDEPVTILLSIHNPDATINTFYQHNQVKLTWKKDEWNDGWKTAEATCKRVKNEIDVTKKGTYNESDHTITWTVQINPYKKEMDPDWEKVRFDDWLPEGLKLDPNSNIDIQIQGGKVGWGGYSLKTTDSKVVNSSGLSGDEQKKVGTFYIEDLGTYHDANPWGPQYTNAGISGTSYTVTYKTVIDTDDWNKLTSSETGSESFKNNIRVDDEKRTTDSPGGPGDEGLYTTATVDVSFDDYLHKTDETPEWTDPETGIQYVLNVDANGSIVGFDDNGELTKIYTPEEAAAMSESEAEEAGVFGNTLFYHVEVNPESAMLNSGQPLYLTDRINTNMELITSSVMVYQYSGDPATAKPLNADELASQGISISYNDDTRYLMISGIKDQTHYKVTYLTAMRAIAKDTFTNTATLIGGGSHSDKVQDEHQQSQQSASIERDMDPWITIHKIDENNITLELPNANFRLYKCILKEVPYTGMNNYIEFTLDQWKQLLADAEGEDEAVRDSIRRRFKIVDEEEVMASPTAIEGRAVDVRERDVDRTDDGYPTKEEGVLSFQELREHVLYYWVETKAPDGYVPASTDKHYFVLYLNKDSEGLNDTIRMTAQEHKEAAWALDDACQLANNITVASMSAGTKWNVTNRDEDYTSITATKRWEGDNDDYYETRPKGGIKLNLYSIDADGNEKLESTVPINKDADGYWPDFTWYGLSSAYTYKVVENRVKDYTTTYSNGDKAVDFGTITVTNTFVPKNTNIYVQKKWDPEEGTKPSDILVRLYRYETNDNGETKGPIDTGMSTRLTAANDWKDGWENLPTSDDYDNTLTYTVREDVDAVNAATGEKYGAVYSDGGKGVVSAESSDPLVITNQLNAPGSLKITKKVTVNGESVSDAAADGTYRFQVLHRIDEGASAGQREAAKRVDGTVVGDVEVTVTNGKAATVMVDNLPAGTYYVSEYEPTNGAALADPAKKTQEVEVVAGVTKEADVNGASFTNNVERTRVKVSKNWKISGGSTTWPSGMEVKVTLKDNGVTASRVQGDAEVWLNASEPNYMWDGLVADHTYTVEETAIRMKKGDGYVTSNAAVDGKFTLTVDGTTYSYAPTTTVSVGDEEKEYTSADTSNVPVSTASSTTSHIVTNTQVTQATFIKKWSNADGTNSWPASKSITIQLWKRDDKTGAKTQEGSPITLDANNINNPSSANGTVYDASGLSEALGGGGYRYTWTGLPAGYTYSVEETQIDGVAINSGTASGYLSQQLTDRSIENVANETSVKVTKVWKDADGKDLETWPKSGSANLVVHGKITRERRRADSTLESDWLADTSNWYNGQQSYQPFTISNGMWNATTKSFGPVTFGSLAKYGNVDINNDGNEVRFEYRYKVEEEYVTAGNDSDHLTSFAFSAKQMGDTWTLTNTPVTTSVSFKKNWSDGTSIVSWPMQNGDPVPVTIKIQRKADGTDWESLSEDYNVTSESVVTVYDLPSSGFMADGTLVKYEYRVAEPIPPAGYQAAENNDSTQDGTTAHPYTITNEPKTTSVTLAKNWVDSNGTTPLSSWPKDSNNQDIVVMGSVKRERRVYGTEAWEEDTTYAGAAFTVTNPGNNAVTNSATVDNLPLTGYESGILYEYRYNTATENHVTGYLSSRETTGDGTTTPYTHTFTNEKDVMDLTVKKIWKDEDGNTPANANEYTSTFELRQVRYAKLTVNVEGLKGSSNGSVTLHISDGTSTKDVTLNSSNYDPTANAWQYVYSPLKKGATYTVTATPNVDGVDTLYEVSGTTFTAANNVDQTAVFSTTNETPSTHIKVETENWDVSQEGRVEVNIIETKGGISTQFGTLAIGKSNSWTAQTSDTIDTSWPKPLDPSATYTFGLADYDNVNLAGATVQDVTIDGSQGGTVKVTPITTGAITVRAPGVADAGAGHVVAFIQLNEDPWTWMEYRLTPSDAVHTFTGLTAGKQYKVGVHNYGADGYNYDTDVFSTAYVEDNGSHVQEKLITLPQNGSEVTINTVRRSNADKTLTVRIENTMGFDANDKVDFKLANNTDNMRGTTYRLYNGNNWTQTIVMDGSSSTQYTVSSVDPTVAANNGITTATLKSGESGSRTGNQDGQTILITADKETVPTNEDGLRISVTYPSGTWFNYFNFGGANSSDGGFTQTHVTRQNGETIASNGSYVQSLEGLEGYQYFCLTPNTDHGQYPIYMRLYEGDTIKVNSQEIPSANQEQHVPNTTTEVQFSFDGIAWPTHVSVQNAGIMIPIPGLFLPKVAYAAELDTDQYCIVGEPVSGQNSLSITGTDQTNAWTNLPMHDENGNAIKYYAVETDTGGKTVKSTTYSYDGKSNSDPAEIVLDSSGMVEVTNVERDTQAKVTVRKVFKDKDGNTLRSSDIPNGVTPTFTLKRLVTTTTSSNPDPDPNPEPNPNPGDDEGEYTIQLVYSDGETQVPNGTVKANASDKVYIEAYAKTDYKKRTTNTYWANGWPGLNVIQNVSRVEYTVNANDVYEDKTIIVRLNNISNSSTNVPKITKYANGTKVKVKLIDSSLNLKSNILDAKVGDTIKLVAKLSKQNSQVEVFVRNGYIDGASNDEYDRATTINQNWWSINGEDKTYTIEGKAVTNGEVVIKLDSKYNGDNSGAAVEFNGQPEWSIVSQWEGSSSGSGSSSTNSNTNTSGAQETTTTLDTTYGGQQLGYPNAAGAAWHQDGNGDWYWEASFTTKEPTTGDGGKAYTYYVEESWPAGQESYKSLYETTYSVGETSVALPVDNAHTNETGWLNESGTVTVTNANKDITSVTATKQWKDTAIGADVSAAHASDTVTLTLWQVVTNGASTLTTDSNSGLVKPGTPTKVNNTGITNPVVLNSDDTSNGGIGVGRWSYTWNNLPVKSGGQNIYYYVEETAPTGARAKYDDYKFNTANDNTSGVKSVIISNEETSVSVEKRWRDGETDTSAQHTGQKVTMTLYRVETERGHKPAVSADEANGLWKPSDATQVEQSVAIVNQITLDGNTSGDTNKTTAWNYTWSHLPVGTAEKDYTYYVEETATDASGMKATYAYYKADGTVDDQANTGAKKVVITNHETSVSAQKVWKDAVTGANTTSYHTSHNVPALNNTTRPVNDTATLTLYKVRTERGQSAASVTPDAATGLSLPDGAIAVPATYDSETNTGIKNPVILNHTANVEDADQNVTAYGVSDWSYDGWTHLPTQETDGGTTYDLTYYVAETDVTVDEAKASAKGATYAYTYNGDAANTGVKSVVITNLETRVSATKTWVDDTTGVPTSLSHRTSKVTFELWKALKERGAAAGSGKVSLSTDTNSHLVAPQQVASGGEFALYDKVDTREVSYSAGGMNWPYTWEHLPTVESRIVDGEERVYDVVYFVSEAETSEGAASATYENYVFVDAGQQSTGVRSVSIVNHETSVEATKTWAGDHTRDTVTLELWRARKALTGQEATSGYGISVDFGDGGSGLAFPVPETAGGFMNRERVGSKTLTYDADDSHADKWYYKWTGLPTLETVDGITYELKYYVREVSTSKGGAGATYTETYNTTDDATSGVKSVAIENHTTNVTATKTAWGSDNSAHSDDKITLELYKALEARTGETAKYIAKADIKTGLVMPTEITGSETGTLLSYELADTQAVGYTSGTGWTYTWNDLPEYELDTATGKSHKVVYFVREVSITTGTGDSAKTLPPSAYYDTYTYKDGANSSSGVSTVSFQNTETNVTVAKTWGSGFSDAGNYKATFQLYKARKVANGGTHKVVIDNTGSSPSQLAFPQKTNGGDGTLINVEAYGEPVVITGDDTNNTAWAHLPATETDVETDVTYDLVYFVREVKATDGSDKDVDATAEYAYSGLNGDNSTTVDANGLNGGTVTVTNKNDSKWKVTVQKVWSDGADKHSGDSISVQLQQALGTAAPMDVSGKTATLDASNSWTYTFEGLEKTYTDTSVTPSKTYTVNEHTENNGIASVALTDQLNYSVTETGWNSSQSNNPLLVVTSTDANGNKRIVVTKQWTDGKDHSSDTVKFRVKRTHTEKKTKTVTVTELVWENSNLVSKPVMETVMENGSATEKPKTETVTYLETIAEYMSSASADSFSESTTKDAAHQFTLSNSNLSQTLEGLPASKTVGEGNDATTYLYTYHVEETTSTESESRTDASVTTRRSGEVATTSTIVNEPTYTGGLKLSKTFSGTPSVMQGGTDPKNNLKFEISYVESELQLVDGQPEIDDKGLYKTIDITYYGLLQNGVLVWKPNKELSEGQYVATNYYNETTHEPANGYSLITYANFATDPDGDSSTYTIASTGLPTGRTYRVREINADKLEGIVENYNLTPDSVTDRAAAPPERDIATVSLSNNYQQITGAIKLTKNVKLNGEQKYDNVASGQIFYVGLEEYKNDAWESVTETITVQDGAATRSVTVPLVRGIEVGKGSKGEVMVDGLPLGTYRAYELTDEAVKNRTDYVLASDYSKGSTSYTAGQKFRAYGTLSGNTHTIATDGKLYNQREVANGSTGAKVNGYVWDVSETGTYYSNYGVSTSGDTTTATRTKVDGDGTWTKTTVTDSEGKVSEAGSTDWTIKDNNKRVSITGTDGTSDTGVTISNAGGEDEKATRFGYLDLSNAKTQTGTITVNKAMLLNGGQDTTKNGQKIYVGLYTAAPPTNDSAVKKDSSAADDGDVSNSAGNWVKAVTLDDKGEGSVSFAGLVFDKTENDERVPVTYHVFELAPTSDDDNGSDIVTIDGKKYKPVTGSSAQFTFKDSQNNDVTREYVVSADDKPQILNHETPDAAVDITNSYTQRGKLAFRKVDKDTWNAANPNNASNLAGAAFTLTQLDVNVNYENASPTYSGAFNDGNGGTGDPKYKLVGGNKIQKISVLTNTQGQAVLADLADGVYEGKESTAPPGYLIVGDSTFYVEVKNGQVTFLDKTGSGSSATLAPMPNPSSYVNPNDTNVLAYAAETRSDGGEVTAPAVVTIGDTAGPELPSTGGPGLWPLLFAGVALAIASAAALLFERRRA